MRSSLVAGMLAILSACGGSSSDSSNGSSTGDEPDITVEDIPIAYVRRSLPFDENEDFIPSDAFDLVQFTPGAELFVRIRAAATADEVNVTGDLFEEGELYDVKDLSVSNDGSKLLFALRAPELENVDDDEQPTWNIWEYNLEEDSLRRIIADDITAEEGQDINPSYLPDGRIVFSSNRQIRSKAILLDDNKPQYEAQTEDGMDDAFVLHVMDENGTNLSQLTYNQSHDFQPTVLPTGEIAYLRWDNLNRNNRLSLYTTRPDGQDTMSLYGYNSQSTGTEGSNAIIDQPKPMSDDRLLAILRTEESRRWGGDIITIDYANYSDRNQANLDLLNTENPGEEGDGQRSLSTGDIIVDEDDLTISRNGYFAAAHDLFDNTPRLLVSWTDCRLQDPNSEAILACTEENLAIEGITEAPPLYGLWIYNLEIGTLQPIFVPEEGVMYSDVAAFANRTEDLFLADRQGGIELDQDQVDDGLAQLHIRNVYEVEGIDTSEVGIGVLADPAQTPADERPALFLKIEKAVSMPDDDTLDFDRAYIGVARTMREIIGYAPVEPDGSVLTLIPADVALAISIVDQNARRVSDSSTTWIQARPGEVIDSHGLNITQRRRDQFQASTNTGAPVDGYNFPNTEPLLIGSSGQTMAQTYAQSTDAIRAPSVDIIFNDDWTDPAVRAKDDSFEYRYNDLLTPAPASEGCISEWSASCRVIVNYPDHIQPLWELPRQTLDDMNNVIADNTCTLCHNTRDAMGAQQVPAGQLELTASPLDTDNRVRSYLELLANDNEDEIVDGALVERTEERVVTDENGNIVYQTDNDGNLILDADNNPIPEVELITFPITRTMTSGNALNSRFFEIFDPATSNNFEYDHNGALSDAELRLLSEWLDIGGQYYNNPFDAPLD
ncbi:hypothetical protein GCM10007877_05610 [Marinibactrum halimedae]|uniref:Hydrazine synthase alpha subunit middle domain-containing protein n=2 Tax=Marinibactrum halimedae TaxID=1444977 RepID=A0AA37WNC4_9GAMM|nr:hypothetical protein GCM10007877_05610 [Marinibactrum halimedae]